MELWNMRMARVVELFGLPGDRYITDVNENNMTFWFRDANDVLFLEVPEVEPEQGAQQPAAQPASG